VANPNRRPTPERVQNSPRRAHDLLRTGIRRDLIPRDEKLEERHLTRGYATSRNAVREALQTLAVEGLVTRIPRFGTKLTGRITVLPMRDVAVHGYDAADRSARIEELDLKLVPATPVIRDRLAVDTEHVVLIEHLAHMADAPLYVRVAYLPEPEDFESFTEQLRTVYAGPRSNHEALQDLFGVEAGDIELTVEAVPCDPRTGKLLGCQTGAPILVRERVVYDVDGRPRELSYTHLPGDRAALGLLLREV
jgi:GntR family transcriptional regulator